MSVPQEARPERNTGLEVNILKKGATLKDRLDLQKIVILEANPETSRMVKSFPGMFPDEERPRVRRTKAGTLWMVRYYDPRGEEVYEEEQVPEGSKAVFREWAESKTLPKGIRRARRIVDGVTQDYDELKLASRFVRATISRFQARAVRGEDLVVLADEAGELLGKTNLLHVIKPEKQTFRDRVVAAAQPVDSRGHPNLQRNEMLWTYALYDTLPLFLYYSKPADKWANIEARLVAENELERFYAEEAVKLLDKLSSMKPASTEFDHVQNEVRAYFDRFIKEDIMRLNPYRLPALLARAEILGPTTGNEESIFKEYGMPQREIDKVFEHEGIINLKEAAKRRAILETSSKRMSDGLRLGERILAGEEAA